MSQSWISITLGLRSMGSSLWELGASMHGVKDDFDAWVGEMFEG